MKEEVRQKVMERFSISEQAMQLLLESAEMMSFVMGRKIPFGSPWRARSHSRYGDILPALLLCIP